jgi:hypothetical protein
MAYLQCVFLATAGVGSAVFAQLLWSMAKGMIFSSPVERSQARACSLMFAVAGAVAVGTGLFDMLTRYFS